jgi:dipeptidyl aminopeptidase/acylaminoacyl peptidase
MITSNFSPSSCYQEPSDLLKRLFLPPKDPSLTLSSDLQWLLFAGEPPLPSIEVLAKPEEKLAGVRFDPALRAPSRLDFAFDLTAQHLATGHRIQIRFPDDTSEGIRYIRFNPNPLAAKCLQQFVFVSQTRGKNELIAYICNLTKDPKDDYQWTTHPLSCLAPYCFNFCNGCAYRFSNDGLTLLAKVVPQDHPPKPPEEPVSVGPSIQFVSTDARMAPVRTYQDLLRNSHDEDKFRYFMAAELVAVDLTSRNGDDEYDQATVLPQSAGGALIQSFTSSPSGRFLLVEITTDLSYAVPLHRFGREVQVWDLHGSAAPATDEPIVVASIPVDDERPISYDGCSRHPRSFTFHPCYPHTLLYTQAVDGGDPDNPPSADGERDVVFTQDIQLLSENGSSAVTVADPRKLVGLEWRLSDIDFTESGELCLVSEYRWKDRKQRLWLVRNADESTKQMIWERNWQDRYDSPGVPMTRRSRPNGQYYLIEPQIGYILFKGEGASPLGDRPFLDLRNLATGDTQRLWRSKAPKEGDLKPDKEVGGRVPSTEERENVYETIVVLLDDNDTVLLSRESKTTPRNYYLTKLSNLSSEVTVTTFPHPQPDLLGVTKELVHYQRKDGVALTANLYLPRNYDGTPRPTLFWAYPREFKDSKAAGQVKSSQHRFVSASWASPVHWAAKGWAVMDDFALPVIGEGDTKPNDTFIEQIVDGATAAVEFVTGRGVTDPTKCAVGGHSYGSFMTAHLLSHTSLFAAGIGRSGAFNRTLTPMSFQSEDRSLWEAPETYIEMSPLMHVKKYSEQERVGKMLLIHGEEDENSGTHPLQSERYFAALKAFGIESRLCKFPHERHSYRARESILHMAWEQEEWLKCLED